MRERLTERQIILMRSLVKRGAAIRAVTVARWQRVVALPLWHRGFVEIWWRQIPGCSAQGPYFSLTIAGAQLASHFVNPAPRGSSGAENDHG